MKVERVRTAGLDGVDPAFEALILDVRPHAGHRGVGHSSRRVAGARKPRVIELVDGQQHARSRRHLANRRQYRIAGVHPRIHVRPLKPGLDQALGPEHGTEVDARLSAADQILRNLVVTAEHAARHLPDRAVERAEPYAGLVQRLVELGEEVRVLPDLGLRQPLASQTVEP